MSYVFGNILAILAATVAAWLFGAAWYNALGKPWMAATGLTEADVRPGGKTSTTPFILSFLFEFLMASILAGALILAPVEAGGWTVAIGTALIIWFGFVMPTQLINHRYSMKPWSLTVIDAGHWLGVMLIMAIVLTLIGVDAPL
ncbi:MAG: DUF1761 domain-containing protein [Pacificimonas sp.]|jgi:hypothetical protein|nr:DUF1761 domain-containing protein [Pacificimonas sp.]